MKSGENEGGDTGPRSGLLPVVGIGASAGGLAALKELLGHMPPDTGLAFVVVVHLSPDHESHLADLLQAHTSMPVRQVTETLQLEPNHIYVIPPGCNLTAIDTHLRLSKLEEERSRRAPIDHFFQTLAEAHHETAVGVVLTGTGSDGTFGLRMIREKGGLTIAQDPDEAQYDSMPQTAIANGTVDQVLRLSEMPVQMVRFATTGPAAISIPDDEADIERDERRTVLKILTQVRARTGHDFSRYKPATVMRRIRRRMHIHQIEDPEEYAERIRRDLDEAQNLLDDLLITVTNFFRDPETFEVLERDVLPKLFAGKGEGERVRAWSVGCATGEEAYSLAILLLEHASRLYQPPQIQVFATDIHRKSLQAAREGLYPQTIEAEVSPERLRGFFTRENDHFRVRPELREVIVFAPHNVIKDPPFSQLDLISCRNLLIYLQRTVQQEIIPLFHYALRPGGYLLVGGSETIDRSELFEQVDRQHGIHCRRDKSRQGPRLPTFLMPAGRALHREFDIPRRTEGTPSYGALHKRMVERYAPPSLLVNHEDAVVHTSARAGKYLTVPGGEPTTNVFRLVREPLRLELRAGLFEARDRGEAYRSKPIQLEVNGKQANVRVRVQPADDDELANLFLVIFDEVPVPASLDASEGHARGATVREVEEELSTTRARLHKIIEEHEASQEEMGATNEELQTINEELRSTMEELETSKEELQSINEELATVNQENRHKVEELAQLSSDLQNLLSATDIATLFLDRQLRIMRFTPPLAELFNVRRRDRGRPISDLSHQLGEIALEDDARQVLDSLKPLTREAVSHDGRWFLTRILPYRSTDDRIGGVVITFVDITVRMEAEAALTEAKEYSESIIETLHEPLLVLAPDLQVRSVNRAFCQHFQVEREATIGRRIYDLGDGQWDTPELRTLLEEVLPDNEAFNDFEVRHTFQGLGERVMLLNARRLDHMQLVLVGIRDITEKRRSEEELMRSEQRLKRMVNIPPVGILTFDYEGNLVHGNDAVLEILGYGREEFEAESFTWRDFTPPEYVEVSERVMESLLAGGRGGPYEKEYIRKDGSRVWMMFAAGDLGDGTIVEYAVDVSARKQAEGAVRESEARFRTLADLVPDLLWRSDPTGHVSWCNQRWIGYTGQSAEDVLGRGWMEAVHPDDRERSLGDVRRAADERKPLQQVQRIRRHDGTYRWFLVRAEPLLDEDGEVGHFFGSATDIHEQWETQGELEERVQDRTRQLRELTYSLRMAEQEERHRIAHLLHDDLQQLLFGVRLRLNYLVEDAAQLDRPEFGRGLKEACAWIGDAIACTRELAVDLNPPVLKGEGLGDALGWLASQMWEKHQLKVHLHVEDETRVDEGVAALLFQIVRELLFNVVKHADVSEASVAVGQGSEDIRLEVSDAGSGFDLEAMLPSRSLQTGLGLFSVRERLRLMGGEIEIDTAPGQGTRIRASAPRSYQAAVSHHRQPEEAS